MYRVLEIEFTDHIVPEASSCGYSSWLLDRFATLIAIPSNPHSHILNPSLDSSLRLDVIDCEARSSSSKKFQIIISLKNPQF